MGSYRYIEGSNIINTTTLRGTVLLYLYMCGESLSPHEFSFEESIVPSFLISFQLQCMCSDSYLYYMYYN